MPFDLTKAFEALRKAEDGLAELREMLVGAQVDDPPMDPGGFSLSPDPPKTEDQIIEDWFRREAWPLTWRKVGKAEALQKCFTHATTARIRAQIIKAMKAQRPGYMAREEEFRPHLATWISKKKWQDEITPVEAAERKVKYFDPRTITEING